jgi:serine/threonine protein kinase
MRKDCLVALFVCPGLDKTRNIPSPDVNCQKSYINVYMMEALGMNVPGSVMRGGDVIGSGGFGCVFAPKLKCATPTSSALSPESMISKLMSTQHANDEYKTIREIQSKIIKIPNHSHYFLLDNISVCKPAKLDKRDLEDYEENCGMLEKVGITAKNMNSKLNKLLILNMPRGGISIDDYFEKNVGSIDANFIKINNGLIQLLERGIVGMNRQNIYHCDLKGANVLIDAELVPRIIDWGLSNQYVPVRGRGKGASAGTIPEEWTYYSVQFNTPFSSVFFGHHFEEWLADHKPTHITMESFMRSFVSGYIAKQRHYAIVNSVCYMFFLGELPKTVAGQSVEKRKKWVNDNITIDLITRFLYELVIHFDLVDYATFKINVPHLIKYLNTVYIHIVDIWGFIMTYLVETELLYQNYHALTANELKLFESLRAIFIDYLYTPQFEPISVPKLATSLRNLNQLFAKNHNRLHSHSTLTKYSTYRRIKNKLKHASGSS